jgi:hypothetical protein
MAWVSNQRRKVCIRHSSDWRGAECIQITCPHSTTRKQNDLNEYTRARRRVDLLLQCSGTQPAKRSWHPPQQRLTNIRVNTHSASSPTRHTQTMVHTGKKQCTPATSSLGQATGGDKSGSVTVETETEEWIQTGYPHSTERTKTTHRKRYNQTRRRVDLLLHGPGKQPAQKSLHPPQQRLERSRMQTNYVSAQHNTQTERSQRVHTTQKESRSATSVSGYPTSEEKLASATAATDKHQSEYTVCILTNTTHPNDDAHRQEAM